MVPAGGERNLGGGGGGGGWGGQGSTRLGPDGSLSLFPAQRSTPAVAPRVWAVDAEDAVESVEAFGGRRQAELNGPPQPMLVRRARSGSGVQW